MTGGEITDPRAIQSQSARRYFPDTCTRSRPDEQTSFIRFLRANVSLLIAMFSIAGARLPWIPAFRHSTHLPLRTFSTGFRLTPRLKPVQRAFQPLPTFRSIRSLATATFTPTEASATATAAPETARTIPKSLPYWLFGCSALVFGILIIGGLTRLTESGLSITEWNLVTGIRPPITKAEWDAEWEKYKVSPEGVLWVRKDVSRADPRLNSKIEMSEFKKIFYMEWGHRVAGRALGLV